MYSSTYSLPSYITGYALVKIEHRVKCGYKSKNTLASHQKGSSPLLNNKIGTHFRRSGGWIPTHRAHSSDAARPQRIGEYDGCTAVGPQQHLATRESIHCHAKITRCWHHKHGLLVIQKPILNHFFLLFLGAAVAQLVKRAAN